MENFYNPLLTTRAVAEELGVSESLVKRWRATGQGPRFVTLGARLVRYPRADLETYIETLARTPYAPTEADETEGYSTNTSIVEFLSSTPGWDAVTPEQMAQVEILAAEITNTRALEQALRKQGLSVSEIRHRILQCVLHIADYRIKGDEDSLIKGEIFKFILIKGRRPGEQA